MDNLTHSLLGLTLARTPLSRAGRGTAMTLLIASNAPDIDIVATMGGAASYFAWHRGPTHGPLGIIGLGFLTALIVRYGRLWNRRSPDPPAPFPQIWAIASLGVLCHVLMDLPTPYGTRLFSPFDWTWFAVDWMPIIDVYLLAILGAGLLFGRHQPITNAVLALTLMLGNYGVRAVSHDEALDRAPQLFGAQLPARCDDVPRGTPWISRWPRPDTKSPRDRAGTRCLVEFAAMPDFASPFRWNVIAQLSNGYEIRSLNLFGTQPAPSTARLVSVRVPNQWTPAVERAAATQSGQVFLGFSRFPAARSTLDAAGNVTVRWADVRFSVDLSPRPRDRTQSLFGATVRVGPDGTILSEQFGR